MLDLNAKAPAARIENVIRTVTDVPITGWFETDNHITGTAANPIIEGRAHLWDGSAYGKLVTNAFAKYNYQNDTLELYRFDIEGYGATITGGGTVSKEAINIDFEGKKKLIWADCSLIRITKLMVCYLVEDKLLDLWITLNSMAIFHPMPYRLMGSY